MMRELDDPLNWFGNKIGRALAVPVAGEEIGKWGFMVVFDEKEIPFSREEIEFVKSFASVLALALLRLQHNTTLRAVLQNAITGTHAYQ